MMINRRAVVLIFLIFIGTFLSAANTVTPTSLNFTATAGGAAPAAQTLMVSAPSGASLPIVISVAVKTTDGTAWLKTTPTTATLTTASDSSNFSVSVDPSKLKAGAFTGTLTFSFSGGALNVDVPVTLNLGAGGTVSPTSLSFTAQEGTDATAQQLMLASAIAGTWSASQTVTPSGNTQNDHWLSVPLAGTLPGPLTVAVASSKLPPGTYNGIVSIAISGATTMVPVTLTVSPAPPGHLAVSQPFFNYIVPSGTAAAPVYMSVTNTGGTSINWTATAQLLNGSSWLSIFPSSGTTTLHSPSPFQFTLDPSKLPSGVFNAIITFTDGVTTIPVPVQLTVSGHPTLISDQTGLTFNAVQGTTLTPAQILSIVPTVPLSATDSLSWTASVITGSSIFHLLPASGTVTKATPNVTLVVADATGLAPGAYYGVIKLQPGDSTAAATLVSLALVVVSSGNQQLSVYPRGLVFVAPQGGAAPSAQNLTVSTLSSTAVPVSFLTAVDGKALTTSFLPTPATPVSIGNTAVTESIGVKQAGLTPGVYQGTVLAYVTGAGSSRSQSVTVYLVVPFGSTNSAQSINGPKAAACAASQVITVVRNPGANFSATAGLPTNLEVLLIDDCGVPQTSATVQATFSNGDPAVSLINVGNGIYSATWKPVMPNAAAITFQSTQLPLATVTQVVNGAVNVNSAPPPAISSGGAVNGASFSLAGGLAPCSIVSIFGSNLATASGMGSSLPLVTTLNNSKISIGGIDAPFFYASATQVNVQVPCELPVNTQTQAVARLINGSVEADSIPESVTISEVQPAIFLANAPSTQGVILNNPALQIVDNTHPAAAGDVLTIYCTGLGAVTPAVATGVAALGGTNTSVAKNTVTATIGGVSATVLFAGLTPGLVGLGQVNLTVPAGVKAGSSVPVILTQKGVSSPVVTIAVK